MRPRSSPKLNRVLLAILMLSVFGFFGIVFYAYRWDAGQSAMGEGTEGTKEEQETSSHDMTVLPIPEIASMSRSMPRLVRVAEADSEYIEVPLISQKEVGYTTGCELVSAAMVLNYYGKNVTTDDVYEVIDKITPTGDADYLYADPERMFIGNPKQYGGFGCYAEPLTNAMNRIFQEEYYAVNISGTPLETLEREYLSQGIPVIIWATIRMKEPEEGASWELEDGRTFQWLAGEHCLVLVGFDETYYYFNDPDWQGEVVAYEKEQVDLRYRQLGSQAIVVSR